MSDFTTYQLERYDRHIRLAEIGREGQQRLLRSSVLVVGAGGLGSPVLLYLAAAGVGRLGIVDADTVSLANLQRQVLHTEAGIGTPKVESARSRLLALNPALDIRLCREMLSAGLADTLFPQYDFIIDCTDNFSTKYLINDAAVRAGKPASIGGVSRFDGQLTTIVPGGPCYRCLFPTPPPAEFVHPSSEVGILGAIPGMLGTIQACEAVKWLTGAGEVLSGRLLNFDALQMRFSEMSFPRNPHCPACGKG